MAEITPIPIELITEWIKNVYGLKGVVLLAYSHEDAIDLIAEGLSYQDVQNALATAIYINRTADFADDGYYGDEDE